MRKDEMDEVKLKKITESIGLMQKNLECSICLDLLQDPVSTKCDHQFCNFCVLALLQSSKKPSARCPLCKVVITKRSLTKNEQLDEIVKAVRSVITAVEEDSGYRCSPPRGPVFISQPDPKPRHPSPQKKVKGQLYSKVKGQGRAGNVRRTKRKVAETVTVYQDDSESSDSDAVELPLVGHTNICSSFPKLRAVGKKSYNEDDDLEKEAEDLLAALNAAPLTSHNGTIPGYTNNLEQRNNEINLRPVNSENKDGERHVPNNQASMSQDMTPPPDSEIFEVPAPPRLPVKQKVPQEGSVDPYEFVPSQRTPRKVKKKGGRKKNTNAKKEFPIRSKGRFTKTNVSKKDSRSASSCSESDQENASNRNRTRDEAAKDVAPARFSEQRNDNASSKNQNVTSTTKAQEDGSKQSHPQAQTDNDSITRNDDVATVEDVEASEVIDDTGDVPDDNARACEGAQPAERNLMKQPLPITPVVVIQRKKGLRSNPQGSQQSSEGGMINDSQPVVINRNHGRRVFATTYGKAKNGLDKSPPLDPQERVKDWLVSKNGSDSSDDEEGEEEEQEKDDAEELLDFLNLPQDDDLDTHNSPVNVGDNDNAKEGVSNRTTPEDQSEHIEEKIIDKCNKSKVTPKKKEQQESDKNSHGKRRSGRHIKDASQEKKKLDIAADKVPTVDNKVSPTKALKAKKKSVPKAEVITQHVKESHPEKDTACNAKDSPTKMPIQEMEESEPDPKHKTAKQSKKSNHQLQNETAGEGTSLTVRHSSTKRSVEEAGKEPAPKPKTAKQRMRESHKQQTEAARKETEAATIKSDWELALELARQFGTEPEHLKVEANEATGRSSRRKKGQLTIQKIPESKPVRKSRRQVKENQDKENESDHETIEIDSFETQKPDDVPAKTTAMEKTSGRTSKRKVKTSKGRKLRENQTNIENEDETNEVQPTPENAILRIPETPFILNQPTRNTSPAGDCQPETVGVQVKSTEQELVSSQRRETVQQAKGSSSQDADKSSHASNPSQTSSLRRSKRGSHPMTPDSSSDKVSAKSISDGGEKKEKSSPSDEVPSHGRISRKTSRNSAGNESDPTNKREMSNEKESDLPVMEGQEKDAEQQEERTERKMSQEQESSENEAEREVDNEDIPLASLPLYTEDVPKGDLVGPKKCRGSDTTESIDLEIDSDDYEEADDGVQIEPDPLPEGPPAEKDVDGSSSNMQQKANLDEEMSIMDCILPSSLSQKCPVLGVSPDVSRNSSETTPDQLQKEEVAISVSQGPAEVLTVLSGSGSTSHEQSQASVMIVSQAKTSGSFPVSLDVNSQPSESLLQPVKKQKKKGSQDDPQMTSAHTPDSNSIKKHITQTSPGADQKIESTRKESSDKVMPELQASSESSNSRPTRRISRRKRKTFTINASPTVTKEVASPVRQEIQVPDSLEDLGHTESQQGKEANQIHKSPAVHQRESGDIQESDRMQEGNEIVTVLESIEPVDENSNLPQPGSTGTRKQRYVMPTFDKPNRKRRSTRNTVDNIDASPASVDTSQETVISDTGGSGLKSKRKSRNSSRRSSQEPSQNVESGESVVQLSPLDQIHDRKSTSNKVSSVTDSRRSSGRRSKSSPKVDIAESHSNAIPTTPGASEVNEQSSSVIHHARPHQLHQDKSSQEGPKATEKRCLTPRSSPRVLRRSSRQSRDMTTLRPDKSKSCVANSELDNDQDAPPQTSVNLVDDSVDKSLAEKGGSQQSNKSSHSVEDIFNLQEESRDMFDDDDVEDLVEQDVLRIEESQSIHAEIMFLSEDLSQKDGDGPDDEDDVEYRTASEAKQETKRKSTTNKSQRSLNASQQKNPLVSQGSCNYEETEALIPPTPPCHDMSKARASSFVHVNGFSKTLANRKKAPSEVEPDISSLLCLDEERKDGENESLTGKSLVMDTPSVMTRRRNRPSPSQAKDKSIADTPLKPKRVSVERKRKSSSSNQTPEEYQQDEDHATAIDLLEISPRKNSADNLRQEEPVGKALRRMTSQVIGDTPVEPSIKSSNESDEIVNKSIKRSKQVIADDISSEDEDNNQKECQERQKSKAQRVQNVRNMGESDNDEDDEDIGRRRRKAPRMVQVGRDEDDESDDDDDDDQEASLGKTKPKPQREVQVARKKGESNDNEDDEDIERLHQKVPRKVQVARNNIESDDNDEDDDEEHIGRHKRKAQRMVQVARDEEDESDDELIPCSFLQTSEPKPEEKDKDVDEDHIRVAEDQTNTFLQPDTEGGSVSSEDSCASHHMNLTSASSILSSQSEIMNTQQQEKTREDMEALKQQMAELQAALAQERGSRSNDDINDENDVEDERNEEDLGVALVGDTEEDSGDLLEDTSASHRRGGRKRTRSKAVATSDEDDVMEQNDEEPRSPSPPPPLSPSTVRKTSSSMSDSIRSVTTMVEQFRKSSSKKVLTKKRRIDDEANVESDDDVVSVDSSRTSRRSKSPRTMSSKRKSKKRRIEMDSSDSEEDEPQDSVRSHPKRSDSRCRNSQGNEIVKHRRTPPARTTPARTALSFSKSQTPGSGKSPSNLLPRVDGTPQDHHTPGDRPTQRRTPGSSYVPSPVDVSMKTQRTNTETFSPAQTPTGGRSMNRSLRTPDEGSGPSPRPRSRPMSLIATGLNRLELREVEQLTSRLANCRFASAFNANTTHVIVKTDSSLVCERTLKYFQGIAARAWIVSFKWIQDSLQARKLLGEEPYEVNGDVVNGLNHQGPRRARTWEGPGFMAKFDLCCIGPFTGLNKDQLVGLCEMCGASTVQHPSLFPYTPGRKAFIVVEPNLDSERDYEGLQRKFRVPVISREWILDSIPHYRSQPITDYLLSDCTDMARSQPIIDIDPDDD